MGVIFFCRLLFKKLPLRVGITIIIHSRINDPVQCWYIRLFCDIIFYYLLWPPPNPSTWGIYNAYKMLSLLEVSLTLSCISMAGGGWAKKLLPKTHNRFNVNSFCLAGLYYLVWGKWLTALMWPCYTNKNHTLSDASLVDTMMLHHAVSKNNEIKITYL